MEKKERFNTKAEAEQLIAQNEAQGLRMLHYDIDADSKRGYNEHGTLTFTDEPAPVAEAPMDFEAEIQALKLRVNALEVIIKPM